MPGGGVGLAWLKEADWEGAWVGTSHLGLRDAMGMSVCSWVLCLFFSMTECLELCVQMYVSTFMSPRICMKMFACPHLLVSTFVHLSMSMFYLCHVYVAPYFSFLCFIHVCPRI